MELKIKIDAEKVLKDLEKIPGDLRKVVLEASAEGVRESLDKHFMARQSEPRKDGFPMQGFWVGTKGKSVRESIQPTVFTENDATITIKHAPLAHKVNLNPPQIRPGVGKKYLTIPAIAQAAGKSAANFPSLIFGFAQKDGSPSEKGKQAVPVLMDRNSKQVFYWLARKVQTPHDPRALPSDTELQDAAKSAAEEAIDALANLFNHK